MFQYNLLNNICPSYFVIMDLQLWSAPYFFNQGTASVKINQALVRASAQNPIYKFSEPKYRVTKGYTLSVELFLRNPNFSYI